MKKVLLIDVDSKIPNLALMKISAYHKSLGDDVSFINTDNPDIVYASVVFSRNKHLVDGLRFYYPKSKIVIGGSGYDLDKSLDNNIEHTKPDYLLYPRINYSLGFTSRGCIRGCNFCVVPKKEGKIKDWARIQEFHEQSHRHVVLLDNNFLASPRWNQNIEYIKENSLTVDFNQGLDIRLITEDIAKILAETKIKPQIRVSFDSLSYESAFRKGIQNLLDSGIKSRNIMVYILVGFTEGFDNDLKRVSIVWEEYKLYPYVMRYNHSPGYTDEYAELARWANRHYFKVCDFKDFRRRNKK